MKLIRLAIFGLLAVLLQAGLADPVSINGVKPDLVFLAVVFIALYAPAPLVYPLAWVLGSMEDVFTSGRFGIYGALYLVVAHFILNSRDDLFTEHRYTQLLVVGLHALLVNLVLATLNAVRYDIQAIAPALNKGLLAVCFTTLLTPFVFASARYVTGISPAKSRTV